ncbi:hypothetical protein [Halorientalis persicus]|uniref:hypothetical protein n=1 Tax=Halorientalis persicus TaxID=1367881 RepID=UPI001113F4C1|nr:hypothetical protein [Halorientalis persicus]
MKLRTVPTSGTDCWADPNRLTGQQDVIVRGTQRPALAVDGDWLDIGASGSALLAGEDALVAVH